MKPADRPLCFMPEELASPSGMLEMKIAVTVTVLIPLPSSMLNSMAMDSGIPSSRAPTAMAAPLPGISLCGGSSFQTIGRTRFWESFDVSLCLVERGIRMGDSSPARAPHIPAPIAAIPASSCGHLPTIRHSTIDPPTVLSHRKFSPRLSSAKGSGGCSRSESENTLPIPHPPATPCRTATTDHGTPCSGASFRFCCSSYERRSMSP